MKVKRERSTMIPKTVTYEVDPEEGDSVFFVVVPKDTFANAAMRGVPTCVAHGDDCEHALAVVDHLA